MPKFDDVSDKVAILHRQEEEELIRALSDKYGHQYINLNGVVIDTDALKLVAEETSKAAECAAFKRSGKRVSIAIRNPNKAETKQVLESLTSKNFQLTVYMASTASLEHAWERYADIQSGAAHQKGMLDITSEEIARLSEIIKASEDVDRHIQEAVSLKTPSISKVVEVILGGAIALDASDVHIEPEETKAGIRYRLDGVLRDIADVNHDIYDLLRSRLKLLSGIKLNITDRAQDGRFSIDVGEKDFEIRASAIPGAYGESIVMRILDPSSIDVTVDQLGINKFLMKVIDEEIHRPNGMIITTGPTGSGKTTALYTFLRMVHMPEIKIITIEDPIEYHIEGIVQTQTSPDYTFSDGLRAILRQDPDVIMVGEIRDTDVAETAIHAALTGHLVFSTLHTNSAVGSFPRLIDLGIDPRMIGSAVNLVMAQRLVRRLCPDCKKARELTGEEVSLLEGLLVGYPETVAVAGKAVYEPVGCEKCGTSGFKGRIGVYEGIRVDNTIEKVLSDDPRESAILDAAKDQQIPTMQQDGIVKVLDGTTSLNELRRVVDLHKKTTSEEDSGDDVAGTYD